ncbi:MAG: Rieske (2Fe-2S) protein [Lewinellaceae bacterium]|nr:Rieske (2Fe-2S) protein [Phaeodactylibacter sp.]MCB9349675.1 Rieske (2Fe-2S) protein [Lewinellaceae bacterium]
MSETASRKALSFKSLIDRIQLLKFSELKDRQPTHALVENTDLVIVRYDEEAYVLYGRCLHRGAMLADVHVDEQDNLICGVHQWDYRIDSGVSAYNNNEYLYKFNPEGLSTFDYDMHRLAGVNYAGII